MSIYSIFETKYFLGLIIYVSLDCLNLLSNYSDQHLAEIRFEYCCHTKFIRQQDQTNLLEEEEGISEISQVDEDNQYEEELANKKVGYDSSCDHIQEEDIQHHGQHA